MMASGCGSRGPDIAIEAPEGWAIIRHRPGPQRIPVVIQGPGVEAPGMQPPATPAKPGLARRSLLCGLAYGGSYLAVEVLGAALVIEWMGASAGILAVIRADLITLLAGYLAFGAALRPPRHAAGVRRRAAAVSKVARPRHPPDAAGLDVHRGSRFLEPTLDPAPPCLRIHRVRRAGRDPRRDAGRPRHGAAGPGRPGRPAVAAAGGGGPGSRRAGRASQRRGRSAAGGGGASPWTVPTWC